MPASIIGIEERLWQMADKLRANTPLRAHEYAEPALGLIFLKFAYETFKLADPEVQKEFASMRSERRPEPEPELYKQRGAIYLPPEAQFPTLLRLRGEDDIAGALKHAMELAETWNEGLGDALPKGSYARLDKATLLALLRGFDDIDLSMSGEEDTFGRVYEYFLGQFALKEGQRGGEFFTPESLVRLIVEAIEPFHGLILDPACGSGGMFVQSARFVRSRQGNPSQEVTIYGQEKTQETVRLCKMNLAVHGLPGEVQNTNSYYSDHFKAAGRFDYVMANPPFNVNGIDKARLTPGRFPLGQPRVDNGNYLWINLFYSALNQRGRAGFVMPNSASDARSSEQEIRQRLVETGAVDMMIAVGPQFFYTVTLPCTLWFLDKGKSTGERADQVLFIDARHIFKQKDRAHREFTDQQIEYLANIARLYRGEKPEHRFGSESLLGEHFPDGTYADVPGLCKVATRSEIKAHDWSLNPGRYVGIAARADIDFDFKEKLEGLYEELITINAAARELDERIEENLGRLLEEIGDD